MENEQETLNTTLSLSNLNATNSVPTSSRTRNRKKPRKQTHPLSTFYPSIIKSISTKLQQGSLVILDRRTELYVMYSKANWEPLLYYPNKKLLPNMVTEFYKNMQVRHGEHDMVFISTMVNNKGIVLDHIELVKALKLSNKHLNLANIDIEKEYVFNKMELKLYLSVLCGIEVPHNLFIDDSGVSFEHFTPVFQNLALIMRSNIFPNTCGTKLVKFSEIKLMYKLASHKVNFNISYLILLQMINGFKKGYMLYGLTLTKVFDFFKINTSKLPNFQVASTITDKDIRPVIPLSGFTGPHTLPVINLEPVENVTSVPPVSSAEKFNFEKEFKNLVDSHNELEKSFKYLEKSVNILALKLELAETMIGILVNILSSTVSRAGRIEDGINQVINAQFSLVDLLFLPLLEEIEEPPVMALAANGNANGNGPSDMKTNGTSGQILKIF